jgi:hypothetical protein
MMPVIPNSRQRASHRRALFLFVGGIAAAIACLLVEPLALGSSPTPEGTANGSAPPEAAIRPNGPTEPVLGRRVSEPGG